MFLSFHILGPNFSKDEGRKTGKSVSRDQVSKDERKIKTQEVDLRKGKNELKELC